MVISILGLDKECINNEIIKCGEVGNAEAIIDLNGSLKNLDVKARLIISEDPRSLVNVRRSVINEIVVSGVRLRSLVGLGELEGEPVVRGVGDEVFGVSIGDKVVVFAKPLMLSLIHDQENLINEIKLLLNTTQSNVSIDYAVKELVNLIISERRSKRVSKTLAYLEELLQDGDVSRVPPYILDILTAVGVVTNDTVNRALLERVVGEVRSRVYPRRS
ncbi:MAG: hypothetical protein TU36_004795 [Vulcanisaeta sp. AZ3]